jgi:rhodanese-related sulfurtransferase
MSYQQFSAREVRKMLLDGDELALLDVREELTFSQNHLLHARSIPLSRLEIKMASLVPRRSTRIVLCDANDGLAERAAVILSSQGYLDVSILQGGAPGWAEAGFELFSGVNVPSKAFGEYVEQHCGTPSIDAADLNLLLEQKADVVVVDSRPFDEFARVSIPTATNIPGAELVLRIKDIAPSPDTLIVVNCAGRTRSIIGAQSLINAGLPNRVVALRNGTMGWALSGLKCDSGADRSSSRPSSDCVEWARKAAAYVAQRYGVRKIDLAILERMQAEAGERTLYLFDVRSPEEYERGHIHAAVSAPGEQLVQATDQY